MKLPDFSKHEGLNKLKADMGIKPVYFKGDLAELTGVTVKLHGGLFNQVRILEGHLKGAIRLIKI